MTPATTRWNGLNRSRIKPNPEALPIARNVEVRRESVNTEKVAERRAYKLFSKDLRERYPHCQMRSPVCTGWTEGVHHVIKRSQGGAKKPGELAEAQGQVFVPSCNRCNQYVERDRQWGKAHGFVKSNPLRRPGLMETER